MSRGPTQTVSFDAQLVFNTTESVLPCKIVVCGFVIVGVQRLLKGLYMVPLQFHTSLSCTFTCDFILCPLLYCVSPVCKLAILSSAHWHSLIFCHPVAPVTLYHFIPISVLIVNAQV